MEYKITRSNITELPDQNAIQCDYKITAPDGSTELFDKVYHEIDDTEAFLVFPSTNHEVLINAGNNQYRKG